MSFLFGSDIPTIAAAAAVFLAPLIATSTGSSRSATPERSRIDPATLAALATVVFIVSNLLHEGAGHGLACVAVGGDPQSWSTAYFECDFEGVSVFGRKFVAAAGTLVNISAGVVSWLILRTASDSSGRIRFFLWLLMAVNLLAGTGYFLFSGVAGVGDWNVVIAGLTPVWFWRVVLAAFGIATYLLCIGWLLFELSGVIDTDRDGWLKTAFQVTFYSYLAGSVTSTFGAFLNPISPVLILMSAAASFGGASGLAWMTQMFKSSDSRFIQKGRPRGGREFTVTRSWAWICFAVLLLLIHVFVFGPSITF